MGRNAVVGAGFGLVIAAAGAGWIGGRQITSPSEVAARTAPPPASVIVAPVEQRTLASEVVVRGTVRYGAARAVTLATSGLKKAQDIVTVASTRGADLAEGGVVMAVSGRPVFVLRGDRPGYRDLGPGANGADVEQLEQALLRLGFDPGPADGTYDGRTSAAVSAMYAGAGWTPFGPTDEQTQAMRAAQADDFTARTDLAGQHEAVDAARGLLANAHDRADRAARAIAAAAAGDAASAAKSEHERLVAVADIAARTAALDAALDAEGLAKTAVDEAAAGVPVVPTKLELATALAAAKQATRAVATARTDLAAAQGGLNAVAAAATRPDAASTEAASELSVADAEVVRSQQAVDAAEHKLDLYGHRPAAGALDQLTARLGVQVPADEVVFLPDLPVRVDIVKLTAGDPLAGPFITVTNSRLAVDGALSLDDARLVRVGAAVAISDADLGIKLTGTVTALATSPGTDGAEPQRFHVAVAPNDAPTSLVGASVVMSITVNSTAGAVLSVPVSALSVAADGASRVQVQAPDRTTSYVTVTPGLSAGGFVAVTVSTGNLRAGDLVVVGERTGGSLSTKTSVGSNTSAATGSTTSTASASGPSTTSTGGG